MAQVFVERLLDVIREARGTPLHVKEIWTRVQARGVTTTAKNPTAIIDLTAFSLKTNAAAPIEKVAPRTWRFVAKDDELIKGAFEGAYVPLPTNAG